MLRRLGALAGAVVVSLALASSAQAAPSAPVITQPLSSIVCGNSVTVKWLPSTPDPGAIIVQYRVDVTDLTIAAWSWQYTAGLSANVGGLKSGHKYVVRVRALQYKAGALEWSPTSARSFINACLHIPVEKFKQYLEFDPWPECPQCGVREMQIDDPVIYRAVAAAQPPTAERIRGLQIEGDGSVVVR